MRASRWGTVAMMAVGLAAPPAATAGLVEEAGSPIATGPEPYWVAAGDVDGDGRPDLVVANDQSGDPVGSVSVLLRQPGGGFVAEGAPIAVGTRPDSVVIRDLDGDGRRDLAVANFVSSTVSVLLRNAANDGFVEEAGSPISVPASPHAIVAGDFNADGRTDLATPSFAQSNITVLLRNAGNDGFATEGSPIDTGQNPAQLAVADFDGDGRSDLAAANHGSDTVSVYLRKADNSGFAKELGNPEVGTSPVAIVARDFDGDGRPDLAVTAEGSDDITVLLRQAGGGFAPAPGSPHPAGDGAYGLTSADFDGDGRPDLAATAFTGHALTILTGTGDGDFSVPAFAPLPAGPGPLVPDTADFDGDGRPDIAVPNNGAATVTVRLNRDDPPAPPPPTPPAGCSPPTAGRVALWRGEDSAADSIGIHQASLEHGAGFGSGMVGRAFALPGDDDYIHVPARPDLDITGDLTLDTWVRLDDVHFGGTGPTGVGGDRILFWKSASNTVSSYGLFIEGDQPLTDGNAPLAFVHGNQSLPESRAYSDVLPWQPDRWYHLAVVRDGQTITFYRDGAPVGAVALTTSAASTLLTPLGLGGGQIDGVLYNPIKGSLDEAGLWNRALTAGEVSELSLTGQGACDLLAPDTTILIGPDDGATVAAPPTYEFTADEPSTFACQIDDGPFEDCTSPRTLPALADGTHTFAVRATDAAGNVDPSPAQRQFVLASPTPTPTPPPPEPSPAPTAPPGPIDFTWSPRAKVHVADAPLTFAAPTAAGVSYAWDFDFDPGAGFRADPATGPTPTHTFSAASAATSDEMTRQEGRRSFTVRLRATAPDGEVTVVDHDLVVVPNSPPLVDFVTDSDHQVSHPVTLTPQVSDPDAQEDIADRITRLEWDFDSPKAGGDLDLVCDADGANCTAGGKAPGSWLVPKPKGALAINFFNRGLQANRYLPLSEADLSAAPKYDGFECTDIVAVRSCNSLNHDGRVTQIYDMASRIMQSTFNLDAGEATGAQTVGPPRRAARRPKQAGVRTDTRIRKPALDSIPIERLRWRRVTLTAYDTAGAAASATRSLPLDPDRPPTMRAWFVNRDTRHDALDPTPPRLPIRAHISQTVDRIDYPLTTASELQFDASTTRDPDGDDIAYYTLEVGKAAGCGEGITETPVEVPQIPGGEVINPAVIFQHANPAGAGPIGNVGAVGNVRGRGRRTAVAHASLNKTRTLGSYPRPDTLPRRGFPHFCNDLAPRSVNDPIDIKVPGTLNPVLGGPDGQRAIVTTNPRGLKFIIPQEGTWSVAVGAYDKMGIGSVQVTHGFEIVRAAQRCGNVTGQPFRMDGGAKFGFAAQCVDTGGERDRFWTKQSLAFNGIEFRPSNPGTSLVARIDTNQGEVFATDAREPANWTSPVAKTRNIDFQALKNDPGDVDVVLDGDVVARIENFTFEKARQFLYNEARPADVKDATYHGSPIATPIRWRVAAQGGGSTADFQVRLPDEFGRGGQTADVHREGKEEPRSVELRTNRFGEIARRHRRQRGRAAAVPESTLTLPSTQLGPITIGGGKLEYDPKAGMFEGRLKAGLQLPGGDPVGGSVDIAIADGALHSAKGTIDFPVPLGGNVVLKQVRFGVISHPLSLNGGATVEALPVLTADLDLLVSLTPSRGIEKVRGEGAFSIAGLPLANAWVEQNFARCTFQAGGQFGFDFGPISMDAGVDGGFSCDPIGFYIDGNGELCAGLCIDGEVLISNIALAGCAEAEIDFPSPVPDAEIAFGGAVRFSEPGFDFFLSCDLSPYRPAWASRQAGGQPGTVTVPKAFDQVAFRFQGVDAPPRLTLRAPDGRGYVTPGAPGDWTTFAPTNLDGSAGARAQPMAGGAFVDQDPIRNTTTILVARPAAGQWSYAPAPGTPAPTQLDVAIGHHVAEDAFETKIKPAADLKALPAIEDGRTRALTLDVPKSLQGKLALIDDGPASSAVLDRIDLARHAGDQVRVVFAPSADAGPHEVHAFVTHEDGLPRGTYVVDRYTAARVPKPSAPRLRIRRGRHGRTAVEVRPGTAGPIGGDGTALELTVQSSRGSRSERTVVASDPGVKRLGDGRFRVGVGRFGRRERLRVTARMVYAGERGAATEVISRARHRRGRRR